MGADNPAGVPPEAGAVRALPTALTLMDQACAWKHDKDLGNRLTGQAFGLLGHDAVLTIIGLQNARKLRNCGTPAREQVIDLAGAGDAGIGTVIRVDAWAGQLGLGTRRHDAGIRGARHRVMAWPAAGSGVAAAGDLRGEEDEQA